VQQALRAAGAAVRFEADEARAGIIIRGGGRGGGGGHRSERDLPGAERAGTRWLGPGWWGARRGAARRAPAAAAAAIMMPRSLTFCPLTPRGSTAWNSRIFCVMATTARARGGRGASLPGPGGGNSPNSANLPCVCWITFSQVAGPACLQATVTSTCSALAENTGLHPVAKGLCTVMLPCTPRTTRGAGTSPVRKARSCASTTVTSSKTMPPQS